MCRAEDIPLQEFSRILEAECSLVIFDVVRRKQFIHFLKLIMTTSKNVIQFYMINDTYLVGIREVDRCPCKFLR